MKIRTHPHAEAELEDAASDYDVAKPGLGQEFIDAYRHGVRQILEAPLSFGNLETMPRAISVRRLILDRFPFLIIFEVLSEQIVVLAVAHSSRRPNYWRRRRDRS